MYISAAANEQFLGNMQNQQHLHTLSSPGPPIPEVIPFPLPLPLQTNIPPTPSPSPPGISHNQVHQGQNLVENQFHAAIPGGQTQNQYYTYPPLQRECCSCVLGQNCHATHAHQYQQNFTQQGYKYPDISTQQGYKYPDGSQVQHGQPNNLQYQQSSVVNHLSTPIPQVIATPLPTTRLPPFPSLSKVMEPHAVIGQKQITNQGQTATICGQFQTGYNTFPQWHEQCDSVTAGNSYGTQSHVYGYKDNPSQEAYQCLQRQTSQSYGFPGTDSAYPATQSSAYTNTQTSPSSNWPPCDDTTLEQLDIPIHTQAVNSSTEHDLIQPQDTPQLEILIHTQPVNSSTEHDLIQPQDTPELDIRIHSKLVNTSTQCDLIQPHDRPDIPIQTTPVDTSRAAYAQHDMRVIPSKPLEGITGK